jgi:hypothetical protein
MIAVASFYQSSLREWLLFWKNEATAIISTKPSGYTQGFAYSINTETGNYSKIIGNITGLTLESNDSLSEFLVGSGGNRVSLFSLKDRTRPSNLLFLTNTLPEKCVWSKKETFIIYCAVPFTIPNGVYPDVWYQGRVSFVDGIWKINTNTASTNLVSIPERDGGESIDAINLEISEDDSYLTFINKKDLSLWGLTINEKKTPLIPKSTATTTTATTSTSSKQVNE